MSAEERFYARFMMIVGFAVGIVATVASLGLALIFWVLLVAFTFGLAILDREEKR